MGEKSGKRVGENGEGRKKGAATWFKCLDLGAESGHAEVVNWANAEVGGPNCRGLPQSKSKMTWQQTGVS